MLRYSRYSKCFAVLAVKAAEKFSEPTYKGSNQGTEDSDISTSSRIDCRDRTPSSAAMWVDDTVEESSSLEDHYSSSAYRELHRPALTTSGMGLFGGEPGFEKAHRVWVDPDRPHMKHIYNQTALAKNLRYSRYGYFKRDMHLLDVDKLIRHARLLPTPNRLLGDFLYQRVALNDKSCAAFLRYQRNQLWCLEKWRRPSSLQCAEEMFERMLVTNLPPVEVGPETHAEMIRCCAVCREWTKGWNGYYQRAMEVEEEGLKEMTAGVEDMRASTFLLGTSFFDAALELCVSCRQPEEGVGVLEEVITRHFRPRPEMLNKGLVLMSIAIESLEKAKNCSHIDEKLICLKSVLPRFAERLELGVQKGASFLNSAIYEELRQYEERGHDLWGLFEFYRLSRTSNSTESYIRFCASLGKPLLAMDALRLADAAAAKATSAPTNMTSGPATPLPTRAGLQPTIGCFYYLLYAMRSLDGFGETMLEMFTQLPSRGLQADYVLITLAFQYCALHRDGELATVVFEQFWLPSGINPTPEMTLAFLSACAQCSAPNLKMLQLAELMMDRLETIGSPQLNPRDLFDAFIELAAQLGAIGTAFSKVKVLASYGVFPLLHTRTANSLLLANAVAGSGTGSAQITESIASMFSLLQIPTNVDTLEFLEDCLEVHGTTSTLARWWQQLKESSKNAQKEGRDEHDPEISVEMLHPQCIRALRVEWNISPRDIMLRRQGQHRRLPRPVEVGSMLGSIVPFGRSPGERHVI